MSGPTDHGADLTPCQLQLEYRALHQFLHLAPVGLLRAQLSGLIVMMNPTAARLLAPLSEADLAFNLFEMLDPITPDLRLLVQQFKRPVGVVCDNYRVMLPVSGPGAQAPLALGFTVLPLPPAPVLAARVG